MALKAKSSNFTFCFLLLISLSCLIQTGVSFLLIYYDIDFELSMFLKGNDLFLPNQFETYQLRYNLAIYRFAAGDSP